MTHNKTKTIEIKSVYIWLGKNGHYVTVMLKEFLLPQTFPTYEGDSMCNENSSINPKVLFACIIIITFIKKSAMHM